MNKKIMFLIFFICAVSVCAGSFAETVVPGDEKSVLISVLSGIMSGDNTASLTGHFFSALARGIIPAVLIMLSPLLIITVVFSPAFIIAKGFALGFSAAVVIEKYGCGGLGVIIFTLMPQVLIQLPVLCLMTCNALVFSVTVPQLYRNRRDLRRDAGPYIINSISGLILIFISSAIEACLLAAYTLP